MPKKNDDLVLPWEEALQAEVNAENSWTLTGEEHRHRPRGVRYDKMVGVIEDYVSRVRPDFVEPEEVQDSVELEL